MKGVNVIAGFFSELQRRRVLHIGGVYIARNSDTRFLTKSFLPFCSIMLLSVFPHQANAGTIHHWRFENGSFLEDSAGDADLTNTTVSQINLPETDPVSAFPVPGGSAVNTSAAEFHDTGGLGGEIVPLGYFKPRKPTIFLVFLA